jgi:C_GCAxxG_C_C family probable redox protein
MDTKELAKSRFDEGFNCSQAVFSACAEQLGLERDTALKVAAGFGGGMGRMALTCGALTGAFMAIGLKYGATQGDDQATKGRAYGLILECAEKFQTRNGSLNCRDLLGYDLSIPEGHRAITEQGLFRTVCPRLVQDATEIAVEIINR